MSMIKGCTTTKPPSTTVRMSCFLGCFGCSGEKIQPTDKVNFGSRRRSWISNRNFGLRKSATKTLPVKLTTVSRKSQSFQLSEKHATPTSDATWEIQVVEEDTTLTKKSVIMVEGNHDPATSDNQNIRRKSLSQNGSSRSRRKETKAAATTATGPGLEKSVTVSSPLKPLTHSTSPQAGGGADKGASDTRPSSAGGFDSVIGMSVILVTLVMMVLWGKICAILCTSAWFFIAPRLVAAGERSTLPTAKKRRQGSRNNLDLESMEYKKKVVLEGLLQRNHRNVVGGL